VADPAQVVVGLVDLTALPAAVEGPRQSPSFQTVQNPALAARCSLRFLCRRNSRRSRRKKPDAAAVLHNLHLERDHCRSLALGIVLVVVDHYLARTCLEEVGARLAMC
jgi:hypothetical protein